MQIRSADTVIGKF